MSSLYTILPTSIYFSSHSLFGSGCESHVDLITVSMWCTYANNYHTGRFMFVDSCALFAPSCVLFVNHTVLFGVSCVPHGCVWLTLCVVWSCLCNPMLPEALMGSFALVLIRIDPRDSGLSD